LHESNGETDHALEPGLAVVQSNKAEELRQVVVEHLRRHPVAPLEDETILVQSTGTARWLQLGLAFNPDNDDETNRGLGVCAATRFELPAQFMWSAYRAVLGEERLPDESLFDAARLRWLIYRVLDNQVDRPEFSGLRHFLTADDDPRRKYQLAGAIADLFEIYQFYRADWLDDWENNEEQLRAHDGSPVDLPTEQVWQPALWRTLVEMAGNAGRQHRGRLHREFVDALEAERGSFPGLPRRLTVFGISALPAQTLRGLAALSRHSQVLVCLLNPCRYYWGNLVEARDDYRRWNARHPLKEGMPDKALTETQIDQWANPLLASWGKQGKDFIDLLDEMDRPEDYQAWFDDRIDLFSDFADGDKNGLLHRLQQRILDLEPSPRLEDRQPIARDDASIRFAVAHSRQREVEILHDQLLASFQEDESLQPRDIIVMVPDIDEYAPHIEAVFGNLAATDTNAPRDERYIPYTIGDRNDRIRSGFLRAIEDLLTLPNSRLASTTVLDLLQVPALRKRFDLAESDLELAAQWLEGAGVRWGFDAEHRAKLLDPAETWKAFEQNSWRFGLDRMMLGYATGRCDSFDGILPYDEVTPGTAELAARIAALIDRLRHWRRELKERAAPGEWAASLRELVEEFFVPGGTEDALDRYRFDQALDALTRDTAQAGLDEPLPLEVVRDTLLAELDRETLSKRFLAGRVSFSTLMPMRALPFRMVCLLGMNDGDYPRTRKPADFDLMDEFRRRGDRTRRDDDRYLFLEALLSGRDRLHVSWVGRSIRDNSEIPPSVLVGQLRDAIAAGWVVADAEMNAGEVEQVKDAGQQLVEHLTTEHPLQPFSREYFWPDQQRLRTYAREWGEVWHREKAESDTNICVPAAEKALPVQWPEGSIALRQLSDFMKEPVKQFLQTRLRVVLAKRMNLGPPPVDEPFVLNNLESWKLRDELLKKLMREEELSDVEECLQKHLDIVRCEGRLPVKAFGRKAEEQAIEQALEIGERYFALLDEFPHQQNPVRVEFERWITHAQSRESQRVRLEDWVPGMRNGDGQGPVRIQLIASKLNGGEKSVTRANARWDKLAAFWPDHLAACAMGVGLTTIIVGENAEAGFGPVEPETAGNRLAELLGYWISGLSAPLPVTPELSGKFLQQREKNKDKDEAEWLEKTRETLRKKYEDEPGSRDNEMPSIREKNAELARIFPDFSAMWDRPENDDFRTWSGCIYESLVLSQR